MPNLCDGNLTKTLALTTQSGAETEQIGRKIGAHLRRGDVVCLSGDLGAGKTCLTRGLAQAWGAQEQTTSPTFTLINEYHQNGTGETFYHVDCYRMESEADAISSGIEDILGQGNVVVIEWSERIDALLPREKLVIQIAHMGGDSRSLTLTACGARPAELLNSVDD